jgi:ribonucleoside-diphosphate reductase alpha subunit
MTSEIILRLSKSLPSVDVENVSNLVEKFGLYGAARILGYDISHYNNLLMAGRLAIEDLKQKAPKTLLEYAHIMKQRLNSVVYNFIIENYEKLQLAIIENEENDYDHDWFSANTMITMYCAKPTYESDPAETPQYTWMRVAIQMYHESFDDVIKAYTEMSKGYYSPATPTILNAGMTNHQLASCFLLTINDNLEHILKHGVYYGGIISKSSGGLGFDISRIRHSEIGEIGWSHGIVPMIQLYNSMIRYVDQGGRRKGAATVFLRPHHIDVEDFIELPRKVGDKYSRAHDINICLWTSWIFWERIRTDGVWTLFCPAKTPQLNDISGEEFTRAYISAEQDPSISDKYKKVVNAREFYNKILNVQRESGMPYIMNGDAANIKSNHRHLGYIRSSNLCLEIIEFTDNDTIASCNLHSLSLRMFAKGPIVNNNITEAIDFELLASVTRNVVNNLNKVIDNNYYPLDKPGQPGIINKSNKKHRPVGLGASGFAEMLHILNLPFEDPLTSVVNKMVFACIYWNALAQSVQLAINDGVYDSFVGSPTSEGKLQFDLWAEEFKILGPNVSRKEEDDLPIDPSMWGQKPFMLKLSDVCFKTILPTWDDLKKCIMTHGLRNSLLTALMPTASTAQIRRNCESVEAHQNNMYSRKVLTCSYPVLNRYLVEDLEKLGLWNETTVEYIKIKNGSVKDFNRYVIDNSNLFTKFDVNNLDLLIHIEKKFKTMWEIPQKVFMNLAAERGRYIDQSASTNVYIKDCTDDKLRACHMYANNLGLKTIIYYLRQTGGETIKFTADPKMAKHIKGVEVEVANKKNVVCNELVCTSCT